VPEEALTVMRASGRTLAARFAGETCRTAGVTPRISDAAARGGGVGELSAELGVVSLRAGPAVLPMLASSTKHIPTSAAV